MTDPTTTIASDRNAPNIAVDVLPDTLSGTFALDESELDGFDLLGWADAAQGWRNIICSVTSVTIRRGATRHAGVLTRTEPGTMQLSLRDTDRQFDPTVNADVIHPGTPIRVRAWGAMEQFDDVVDGGTPAGTPANTLDGGDVTTTPAGAVDGGLAQGSGYWEEVLFTGRIGAGSGGIRVRYGKSGAPQVTIQALDRVAPLAGWKAAGRPEPGVGGGDTLLSRVTRVLNEMSWPASIISTDVDTAYAATLASTTLKTGWGTLNDAVDAELGRLWVDRNDRLVIRSRDSELSGPVRGTLSDVHDEIVGGTVHCCYEDAEVVYGTELLANRAVAGRRIPQAEDSSDIPVTIVQVDDDYSQARYEVSSVEERSLDLETDAQLLPWAQAIVLEATEPELRVESVDVAPRNAPEAWPQVAATDIGDRWSFRFRPELGPPVAMTVGVLGITHQITPAEWLCEWLTVTAPTPGDANPAGWFLLDVSELDDDDLLATIGGAVAA